nr:hypothetical protein [Agrobacterium tumefaciens]
MERFSVLSLTAHSIIRIELRHKRLSDIADNAVSTLHDILQGVGTIAQKVPTIGNLLCFRCSLPGSSRIRASSVPGDDFNTRMIRKPFRERVLLAVGQQIDNVVRFQIDQDRLVTLPAPPSPVIDSEDPWRLAIAGGICSPRNPQNSVGAHRHTKAGDQSLIPASPPNAMPMLRWTSSRRLVRRRCRQVTSPAFSANMRLPHLSLLQRKRRTLRVIVS